MDRDDELGKPSSKRNEWWIFVGDVDRSLAVLGVDEDQRQVAQPLNLGAVETNAQTFESIVKVSFPATALDKDTQRNTRKKQAQVVHVRRKLRMQAVLSKVEQANHVGAEPRAWSARHDGNGDVSTTEASAQVVSFGKSWPEARLLPQREKVNFVEDDGANSSLPIRAVEQHLLAGGCELFHGNEHHTCTLRILALPQPPHSEAKAYQLVDVLLSDHL
jgi:hypothetical protein